MNAYTIVGPTKRKPRRRSSFESASDSGVFAGISANERGRRRGAGANDQTRSSRPSGSSSAARAFPIAASILPRWRTIPASPRRRSTSASPNAATAAMRKPAKAARNASRLRRIVIHASPAWKPSSVSSPKSASSPCSGRPHSSSW